MDSDKLAQVLQGAGVDPQVINQAYTGLKIPAPATAPADPTQANAPADPTQANAPADATQVNTTQAGQAEPTQSLSARADDEENLKLAADILPIWKKFASQYLAGYGNSPENLKKAAQSFAAKNYPEAGKQALQSGIESVTNAKSADTYVARMANLALVNDKAGINPDQGNQADPSTASASTSQAGTQSTIIDPSTGKPFGQANSAEKEKPGTPAPDAHDEKDIGHDQVPGMEIVQQEPIIVKYKNREFGLDDRGEWVHLGSTKKPHQSFQAMLDKTASFSESFDPAQMLQNKLNK
jgi:hypothetical protein